MTIYSFISAFAAGFAVATLYYLGIATPYKPHCKGVIRENDNQHEEKEICKDSPPALN